MQTAEGEKRAFLEGYFYLVNGVGLYGAAQTTINMKKCLLEHLGFKEENRLNYSFGPLILLCL